MVKYLKNLNGCSSNLDLNSEKLELVELRKEMKRLKRKYDKFLDNEEKIESGSEHDDEEDDKVEEIVPKKSSVLIKGPRTSVSAEVYGNFNIKQAFVPRVIPKTEDQIARIQTKVLKSFIFNNLDGRELKTVVDAMEEFTCKDKDIIIKQGDPGAVLFIIEKGTYDCFKQFVSYLFNNPFQKKDDDPIKVKEYFPGDSFGELALLYNAPRAATIIAKEDGVLWTLDRETFNNIVKEAAIKKREQYESFLKSVDILKSIEPYELSQICDALKSKKYKSGDYIIRQDDIGEEFFIIEDGEAVATKSFNGEEAQKVYSYSRGGYFGELSLIKNEPRAANILAITDCTVLSLERKSFKRLLGPIEIILKRNSNDYLKYMGNQ